MRPYAERREARIERLRARAERARAESESRLATAQRMGAVIPMGQPILVGHHSEGRDRRYRERISRNYERSAEAHKESVTLERRARVAEANTAISSDDPEALARLREKLAEGERQHAVLLEVNKRLRAGASISEVAPMLDWWKNPAGKLEIWRSMGHKTVPTANSSADLRRIKGRIVELERRAARAPVEAVEIGGITVDEEDNRTRIHFPGKPRAEVIAELKSNGFRWCRTDACWQRMASSGALELAQRIAARAAGAA